MIKLPLKNQPSGWFLLFSDKALSGEYSLSLNKPLHLISELYKYELVSLSIKREYKEEDKAR